MYLLYCAQVRTAQPLPRTVAILFAALALIGAVLTCWTAADAMIEHNRWTDCGNCSASIRGDAFLSLLATVPLCCAPAFTGAYLARRQPLWGYLAYLAWIAAITAWLFGLAWCFQLPQLLLTFFLRL